MVRGAEQWQMSMSVGINSGLSEVKPMLKRTVLNIYEEGGGKKEIYI